MAGTTLTHIKIHWRFYLAVLVGIAVIGLFDLTNFEAKSLAGGDAFFTVYLVSTWLAWYGTSARQLRAHAAETDEGIFLIWLVMAGAISLCLWSLFLLVRSKMELPWYEIVLAVASIPLGWAMVHTVMALHYARLFYSPESAADGRAGGLTFPKTHEPELSDFFYYSFVVGMTAQVSDVQVTTAPMRRVTLLHGVASFFYNTVIVALAVNIAVNLGG
ncbi:MAG: DUF1345 domain-containing protein [Hyphomicrobiales bacterium]